MSHSDLCIPGCSSLHSVWSMQPSLEVSQATTFLVLQEWKKRTINIKVLLLQDWHFATPAGPAAGCGPKLHAAVTIPVSSSGTFPVCRHLSVQESFPWRAPVPCLEKAPIIFSFYSSEPLHPVSVEKHTAQEHGFHRKISKQGAELLLYQKLSWIVENGS